MECIHLKSINFDEITRSVRNKLRKSLLASCELCPSDVRARFVCLSVF